MAKPAKWWDDDKRYLRESWGKLPSSQIAMALRRTAQDVASMAKTLRLGPAKPDATSRRCLRCGNDFLAVHPKAVNRICGPCAHVLGSVAA